MGQLWLLVGLALGALAVYLVMRGRVEHERRAAGERVERERLVAAEKVEAIASARDELSNQFTALSSAALEQNNARFLQLAEERLKAQQAAGRTELEGQRKGVEQLVKPVEEKLPVRSTGGAGSSTELLELVIGKSSDAPLCFTCGTKMRPSGACYVCEGCGSTSGCS